MKITPIKESELSTGFKPLPKGIYPFTVLESDVHISKSTNNPGKEMVKLKLNVHGPDFDKHVYDYFSDWFSKWKLKHFFEVVGLSSEYENSEIFPNDNAYVGKTGYVKIGIERNKETGEERNCILDYMPQNQDKQQKTTKKASLTVNIEEDEDMPF